MSAISSIGCSTFGASPPDPNPDFAWQRSRHAMYPIPTPPPTNAVARVISDGRDWFRYSWDGVGNKGGGGGGPFLALFRLYWRLLVVLLSWLVVLLPPQYHIDKSIRLPEGRVHRKNVQQKK